MVSAPSGRLRTHDYALVGRCSASQPLRTPKFKVLLPNFIAFPLPSDSWFSTGGINREFSQFHGAGLHAVPQRKKSASFFISDRKIFSWFQIRPDERATEKTFVERGCWRSRPLYVAAKILALTVRIIRH
jgi:hypothetical protein